jgi:hypothetical protein
MSEAKTKAETPPVPTVTPEGIKVYPTTFLPSKSIMEPSRTPTKTMTGFQIEVIHVIIFIVLTLALFLGMWKKAGQR